MHVRKTEIAVSHDLVIKSLLQSKCVGEPLRAFSVVTDLYEKDLVLYAQVQLVDKNFVSASFDQANRFFDFALFDLSGQSEPLAHLERLKFPQVDSKQVVVVRVDGHIRHSALRDGALDVPEVAKGFVFDEAVFYLLSDRATVNVVLAGQLDFVEYAVHARVFGERGKGTPA